MKSSKERSWLWWTVLLALWISATGFDRLWLHLDNRLPSWDQAEYLSSALDHGRALGLIWPGAWGGWDGLLDLSPKIPPLSSLISGTVMAVAGQSSDQALWAQSLWHGVLLVTAATWARHLGGERQGMLAAALVAICPSLAEHRVEFMLDMPLTASTTLTLWLLYRWQRPDHRGGSLFQAIAVFAAVAASLLIKQSALLVVTLPLIWSCWKALIDRQRRLQVLAGMTMIAAALLPWLHHNWITTIGGTQRAVLVSGAEEGDPGLFNPESWIWYPRLWPEQLGVVPLATGLAGWGIGRQSLLRKHEGLTWLLGVTITGWLITSLSPNKDPRYIAPILPLLLLLIAQGWMELSRQIAQRWNSKAANIFVLTTFGLSTGVSVEQRWQSIRPEPGSPAIEIIETLRKLSSDQPTTLLLAASDRDLNEQTLSHLGEIHGGQIKARRVGRSPGQSELARNQADWWVLATGDQGTSRKSAKKLSQDVRKDPRFERVQQWPWSKGRHIELWRRRDEAIAPKPFDERFIRLARGMELGPAGLAPIFEAIDIWHLLDPRFSYQTTVEAWALQQLESQPTDRDALWSLTLLKVLNNRPQQADDWLQKLEKLDGKESWATAYRMVVQLANWNSCSAAEIGDPAIGNDPKTAKSHVITALIDLSQSGCLNPAAALRLKSSLPKAVEAVTSHLEKTQ